MVGTELEIIRKLGTLASEKKYFALDTIRGLVEFLNTVKPSSLLAYEEKVGKGEVITRFVIEEPRLRELWSKWVDMVTVIYEKGSKIPDLMIDEVMALYKKEDAKS